MTKVPSTRCSAWTATASVGGIGVAVASVGTVTGFGSVIVNGIAYGTSDTEVFIENVSKGSGDKTIARHLSTGMVVRVEGVLRADGNSTANRVFFNNDLRGPVESLAELDPFSLQMVLLSQTVVLTPFCVYQNTSAADLSIGMVLEVSGYSDESGRLQATYVNKIADTLPPGGTVEIKGLFQAVDAQARTYTVNSLTVDFSSADLSGLAGGIPRVGQLLEAKGRQPAPNLLIADRVERVDELGSGAFESADLVAGNASRTSTNWWRSAGRAGSGPSR